jgi:hypothetical protein
VTEDSVKLARRRVEGCPICEGPLAPLDGAVRVLVPHWDQVVEHRFAYCLACDFACAVDPFDELTMSAYYADNPQLRRDTLTMEEAAHLDGQAAFVHRHVDLGPGVDVLEIGADTGAFLEVVLGRSGARGWYDELNPAARQALERRGYRGRAEGGPFDLVVMRHVFEHIPDPLGYLIALREELAVRGRVFLEVPDCSYLADGVSDPFHPEHVSYFTIPAMRALAIRAGFMVEALELARTVGYSTTPNRVLRVILARTSAEAPQDRDIWQRHLEGSSAAFAWLDGLLRVRLGERVVLYGAGGRTREYLAYCEEAPDVRLVDADPKKIGTSIAGLRIEDAATMEPSGVDLVVIMVPGYDVEVASFLRSIGFADDRIEILGGGCDPA